MGTKFVRRTIDPAKLPSLTKKQKADLVALSARPDSEIDFSDIPELTENFWRNAVRGKYHNAIKPRVKMAKRKSQLGVAPVDASQYLDNEEVIAEYLGAALEDRNPDVFLQAVADVAKARGISKLAKDAGLGRESLYKALAPGGKIRYDTVRKLLDSLGLRLTVTTG
jgi:probable addiction module antidote protein